MYSHIPWTGGLMGVGVLLILLLPQAAGNLYSTLHCIAITQTKRLRKEIKYILIHNNTLQSFVWPRIAFSHFENWIFLFAVSLQKWLAHFLLQKLWRNEGFKGTLECHSKIGGSLEITHVFHLTIITSYRKNTLKSHFWP